ncbi:MAG: right-handed parallel beta-helix repeat-containing protein [Phycisphaerales bacterium]
MPDDSSAQLPIDRRLLLGAAGLAGIAALSATRVKAGPLNPPAGAVGSTGKTITEAEPRTAINATNTPGDADSVFRIGQAGSYYLTANLMATTGKNGIKIAASGVTLDLNGFQIGSFGGLAAIVPSSTAVERIVIRNGRIFGTAGGILLDAIPGVVVEGVSVESCSGYGIRVGPQSHLRECVAIDNSIGMFAGDGSCIRDCRAAANSSIGISTGDACTISGCASFDNGSDGISAGTSCVLTACACKSNTANGIRTSNTATVIGCSAEFNDADGISASYNSTIVDCTAFANESDGISAQRACLIQRNSCISNGSETAGSGIRVTFDECRIEGNNCIRNYRGIYVSGPNNFIAANTCSHSTLVNWEIDAGNQCLVVVGVNAAAISGDSGGSSPGSTNPWANFTF